MAKSKLPEWADEWDGRKHCKHCGARLVICYGYGRATGNICSASAWDQERCPKGPKKIK